MKTAFVFPGQGSQFVGMGQGVDLKQICLEGPSDTLKQTEIQQPAIFAVSAAIYDFLDKKPDMVAGHSLGEYSALYAAGSISFEDGVRTVHLRGKFMQEAVPQGVGAMSAVLGGERKVIEDICREIGNVWPANFNSPGQVVISGKKEAVEKAGAKLRLAGAKRVIPLAVSAPFHSPLMGPAADKLAVELGKIEIRDTAIPFICNVTAGLVSSGKEIKELLVKQVTSPVLWEDSVRKMVKDGADTFIEVGPGKVVSGLIKAISPDVEARSYSE
jgi:[acyl-carrier-protein] S-malonyltransferase